MAQAAIKWKELQPRCVICYFKWIEIRMLSFQFLFAVMSVPFGFHAINTVVTVDDPVGLFLLGCKLYNRGVLVSNS